MSGVRGVGKEFWVFTPLGKLRHDAVMPLIPKEEYPVFFKIVLGTAAIVVAYGILHDQYLIRVCERHFTVYHPQYFPTANITLLAVCFAMMATFGPGMVLGYLMYAAARWGSRVKAGTRAVLTSVLVVVLALEVVCVTAGRLAPWLLQHSLLPFPMSWYPDSTTGILITQTTQLVAYFMAPVFSFLALARIYCRRPLSSSA
ncbi:hypothetical protein [Ruficoccus sp. ZRK36]|uniref:hypothetical protein n=1 Tax=Ruficoccus sp. ZRK36 TaxID=2866311 RepID=UPI001C734049|nr:hypothetical protein [Ruficoccus sp. ZRK36]QYY35833.1 hypothetical protein K0V07_16225 [Ruficoccus sp. ZRK36]